MKTPTAKNKIVIAYNPQDERKTTVSPLPKPRDSKSVLSQSSKQLIKQRAPKLKSEFTVEKAKDYESVTFDKLDQIKKLRKKNEVRDLRTNIIKGL